MNERELMEEKIDLVEYATEEEINYVVNYIENFFDQTKNSNKQYSNLGKLSSFLSKNEIDIEELEAEKLLDRSPKLNDALYSLYLAGILVRVNNFQKLVTLLQIYCAKTGYEQTKDVDIDLYEHSYESKDLDLFKVYLTEMGEYKLLTAEEEKKLALQGEEGRNKLAEHNLRLVISIAKSLKGFGVSMSDLVQYGNEGLIVASRKFDVKKGCKFSTYATWWIKQYIKRGISDTSRTIRIPVHLDEIIIKIKKVIATYTAEHNGESPTNETISQITGIPVEKIIIAKNNMDLTISLSTPIGSSGEEATDTFLGDLIEDKNSSIESNIQKMFLKEFVELFENSPYISPREKEILKLRLGFYDGRVYTLEEVGQKFNLTRERIRQLEKKALRRLKNDALLKKFDPKNQDDMCPEFYLSRRK